MQKFYHIVFLVLMIPIIGYAQEPGVVDCCTALQVEAGDVISFPNTYPPGAFDPVADCSCSNGEARPFWFQFECTVASTLEFIIYADPNTNTNYDFVLFKGGCPCGTGEFGEGGIEVVCENQAPDPLQLQDPTGMGDPGYWGYPNATQFQPGYVMEEGVVYYLFVNNVSNAQGVTVEFHPDSQISHPNATGPDIVGPTLICQGTTETFVAEDHPEYEYLWTLDGTEIESVIPITTTLNMTFNEVGTFQLCCTMTWPCVVNYNPSCLTVEVVNTLPKVVLPSDTICFPPGTYPAPDGSIITSAGTFTYTFESFQGCDSIVELTLIGRNGSLEDRSATICEGDCVDFEGEMICETNVYEKTYSNVEGCDSTIRFNLVVVPLETLIDIEDTLTCNKTSVTLDGSLSLGGADMKYIWTDSAGDTIDTDSITVVTEPGLYTLATTSTIAGDTCTDFNTIEVIADVLPPEGVLAVGDTLPCLSSSGILMGSSTTSNVTYEWSGPNGFSSFEETPAVNEIGTYTLVVTGENGCTESATTEVIESLEGVVTTAIGGTVDCINDSVVLSGNSTDPDVTYSWEGPGGATYNVQNPTVSEIGVYTLTVTDNNGCTGTAEAEVIEDIEAPQASATSVVHFNCNSPTVLLNGAGSSFGNNFSYQWTTANGNIVADATTLTPTVSSVGTYTLTVTNDTNGCTNTATTSVQEYPQLFAVITSRESVTCFGADDGSASAIGFGGGGTYTYAWSDGQTTSAATGFSGGIYTVTITSAGNCSAIASVLIVQPSAPLVANASATPESNAGANDGTASANPSGGTPGYSYDWSNGETTSTITDLPPGNYTVTVTDANDCESIQTVTVNQPDCFISAVIENEDVSCNGADDGTAEVTLDNAMEPYTYLWSNGSTMQQATDLAAGTYTVTATDANGCEVATSVTIVQPLVLSANAISTDLTMPNINDGTASASPTGGTSPYTYEWSNGSTSSSINNLAPGDYTVVVTDNNGCTETQTVTVEGFGCIMTIEVASIDVTCFGGSDGQAAVIPSNGLAPFTYEWSDGQTTATVGNLSAGVYDIIVTDSTDCPAIAQVTISEPAELVLDVTELIPTDCGDNNGTATVTPQGGTPGYTYEWSNGQTDSTATGMAAGIYTISITDDNGCTTETQLEIETDITSDNIPPVASAGNLTIELGADGTASISADDIDNGSTDNCGITDMAVDIANFDCSNVGDNTIVLTIIDVGGNTDMATATVTVEDNIAPIVTCPTNMVVAYCDPVAEFQVEAADNCAADLTISQTNGLPSGSEFPEGETTQAFVATDASGNTATCSFTVEVSEVMTVTPSSTDAACFGEDDGTAIVDVNGGIPGYIYEWSNDSTGVSITGLGPGTYTVTVTDQGGCEETGTVEIAIQDNIPPTINCPADIVVAYCDPVAEFQMEGDDNCPGDLTFMQTSGLPSGSEFPEGETTQVFEATDASGNTATCSFTVEVSEVMTVTPSSTDAACFGEDDGTAIVDVNGGIPGYTYEWSNDSTGVSITGLGPGTYTVTVTDQGGCEETGTVEIAVQDNIPPTINCPADIVVAYCDPVAEFQVEGDDNCPGDLTIVQTGGLPSGSEFPEGEVTMQAFEATDASGNSATCSFTVEVSDVMEITPEEEDVSCFGEEDGSAVANVDGGIPGYTYQWSNGGSDAAVGDLGPGIYTVTVTDLAGCQEVGTVEVEEPTQLATTLVNIINEMGGNGDGSVDVMVSGGITPYTYQWTDLDGNVLGDTEDIGGLPAGTYQLFVTDGNGCVSSSAYTIQNVVNTFESDLFSRIQLYPNPSSGLVTIELVNVPVKEMSVQVYDVLGQIAYRNLSAQVNSGKHVLDMTTFPEGVYLVKMIIDGQEVTKRVVRGL